MKLLKWIFGEGNYTDNGDDCKAECLECGKNSMEVSNASPHQWQCWNCKASGNAYTLVQTYYANVPNLNKGTCNKMLSLKEGTTFGAWKAMGLKMSQRGYVVPCHNYEGKVVAMYRFSEDNNTWYSTPKPTSQQVMGLHTLQENDKPIFIAEGHADYAVLLAHFSEYNTLGLCGSSFPSKLFNALESRDVVFLGDNDEAGRQGSQSLAKRMKKAGIHPFRLRYLDWDKMEADMPEKSDIRDLLCEISE